LHTNTKTSSAMTLHVRSVVFERQDLLTR